MPTLERVSSNRAILTFIGPILLDLPGLLDRLGGHFVLLDGLRVPKTRKPTWLSVGRLHYSLSPTLSAHFRRGVRASEW